MNLAVLLSRGPDAPTALVPAELDGPRADEVVVRIEAVGVCHTDLVTRAALREIPAVLGHEGCGEIVEVGADVTDLEVGDRVVLSFRFCGVCERCRSGHPAYCEGAAALNHAGRRVDGSATLSVGGEPVFASFFGQSSFATHAVAAASACVRLTGALAGVPAQVAAPLGCGFLTGAGAVLNVLGCGAGDRLLVVGAGSVGAAALLAARSEGAEVVVVDPLAERRDLAASLGAKTAADLAAAGDGFSHALDTTGRPDVVAATLRTLAPLGVLAVVGLGRPLAEIDVRDVMMRGLQLRGCIEGDAVPRELIPELLRRYQAGDLPLDRLVSTYPLDRLDAAVEDQRAGRVLKAVLVP